MKLKWLLPIFLAFPALLLGQASVPSTYVPQLITYQGVPFGVCSVYQLAENVTNGTYYTCNISTHTWAALGASSVTLSASAGQTLYASGASAITGGTIVLDMKGIAGADVGEQANNCQAALPVAGGTCDGGNLTGALIWSTAFTSSKPVTFKFSGQTISQTAAITFSNPNSGIDGCSGVQPTFTKAGNIDQITLNAANTFARCLTLAGVGGSFTGKGIVASSSAQNSIIYFNNVSSEASQDIDVQSSSTQIVFNVTSHTAATTSMTLSGSGGYAAYNTVTVTGGHGIGLSGNQLDVSSNRVVLSLSSPISNLCGIIANGDQVGDRVHHNQIFISDSNNGDVNYGICDAPSGTHNLNMLFEGNNISGTLGGTAAAHGFFLNNVNNLNTNWSVTVRDNGCVHITACIKQSDSQNNTVLYEDTEPSDTLYDAGSGSLGATWVFHNQTLSFANLPSPAFNNSSVYCSDCAPGLVAQAGGGSGNLVTRINGLWVGTPNPKWAPIQAIQGSASATSKAVVMPGPVVPHDTIVVGVECNQAASPTITITDSLNSTWTAAKAIQSIPAGNQWIQLFYSSATNGGADTVTATSSVNTCTYMNVVASEYSNILAPSPLDGTGASTNGTGTSVASGSFAVTANDLVVGMFMCAAGGAGTGTGAGFTTRGTDGNSNLEDTTPSGATSNATGTCNSGGWAAVGVAFKRQP